MTAFVRQTLAGLRVLLVLTVVLGLAYPATVWLVGRAVPGKADGSFVSAGGRVVGSRLIGQEFTGDEWFHSRPSAVKYDPTASGGSNLGPLNPDLLAAVNQRRADVAAREGVPPAAVPPDAVTASWSGFDPHISPAYARIQVARVAKARNVDPAAVQRLVDQHTDARGLGFLGEPTVNVLELNLAVAELR